MWQIRQPATTKVLLSSASTAYILMAKMALLFNRHLFESLMDFVNTSLSTVSLSHMMTEARIRRLERMIESLSRRVPRIDVLQSSVHRNYMRSDIFDWFLLSFGQACGIPRAYENKPFLEPECAKLNSCPPTIEQISPNLNLVVWMISLFEKISLCDDKDDIRELLGSR
jgi:hypothetical protein